MKIGVSSCLLGENCKYNGGNNYSQKVKEYIQDYEVISLCPEVFGGLSTPRPSSEIAKGKVMMEDGTDVDEAFRLGAEMALQKALDFGVDLCILQSRSPSCGVKQIYDGTFSKRLVKGSGIFAQKLMDAGISVMDVEDI